MKVRSNSEIKKVLLLVENNGYPFDVRVRREAQALRDANYSVSVICPRQKGQPFFEIMENIMVYRFPFPPQGNGLLGYIIEFGYATMAMFFLTFWVWMRYGFDAIHVANPPDTLFMIGVIFKVLGKRFIFDQHDLAPETYLSRFKGEQPNWIYRILQWLEKSSFFFADVVISTNESYKQIAFERGGKNPEQVFVVRNGPPLSYQAVEADGMLRQKADFIIGYIGTMGPQDGVDYWLRAINEMVSTYNRQDFLAVVIGSGDAVPDLKNLVRELNIESYVWFTGRISDADALSYLSTAHICVHPDPLNPLNDRSTMNKMMEYMALEKPVVSFDLTEARHSAQDAALYAKPNDVQDFARKVIWLMDHPEEMKQMGANGRRRVTTKLAWELSVPMLLKAYAVLNIPKNR